jgi:transcription elongation factor Elf1
MAEAPFKCPHCAAEYDVVHAVGMKQTGTRNCDSCGKEMASWKDERPSIYTLRKRPADGDKET